MSYFLCLCDYNNKTLFESELFEASKQPDFLSLIYKSSQHPQFVYSDHDYPFAKVKSEQLSNIEMNRICLNDEPVNISFSNNSFFNPKLFENLYGYVCISVLIKDTETGESVWYKTNLISVMVKKGRFNDNVVSMTRYIYNNFALLLFNESHGTNIDNSRHKWEKGLETRIRLASEIALVYEQEYGFFKANSRYKTEHRETVGDFNKMHQVSARTIQYISQHPAQLHQSSGQYGIKLERRFYTPDKTQFLEAFYSTDIYENQVIVSFLRTVISSFSRKRQTILEMATNLPEKEYEKDEYVTSSFVIFDTTRKALSEALIQIDLISEQLERLQILYSNLFRIKNEQLTVIPKPTPIFLSIPQYNQVFQKIHQWFNIEAYSFQRERFMVSFVMVSQLYELYSLTKLISCIISNGYKMVECKSFRYRKKSYHAIEYTDYPNTFIFKKEEKEITVFYQPQVHCKDEENSIELYRNTQYSFSRDDYGNEPLKGDYYTPDIILKGKFQDSTKYLVIDSKFRNVKSIRQDMAEYTYKYLFSISPSVDSSSLVGLCLLSGKEFDKSSLINVRELERNKTSAYQAWILPLTETCLEKEHNNLNSIIEAVI